jgi:hypothetical protein
VRRPEVGETFEVRRFDRYSSRDRYRVIDSGEVTKVGRRWATIGEGSRSDRFDIKTGMVDGGQWTSTSMARRPDEWPAFIEHVELARAVQVLMDQAGQRDWLPVSDETLTELADLLNRVIEEKGR